MAVKDHEDSSSNDEAAAEEASTVTTNNLNQDISKLLLTVVERLTKMSVLCESRTSTDNTSIKSLIKHMHKFEMDIHRLQGITQHTKDGSDGIYKGAIRMVDKYQNPYDWAYKAIVQKYEETGRSLDRSLDSVDALQKELIERLQVNKLMDSNTQTQLT